MFISTVITIQNQQPVDFELRRVVISLMRAFQNTLRLELDDLQLSLHGEILASHNIYEGRSLLSTHQGVPTRGFPVALLIQQNPTGVLLVPVPQRSAPQSIDAQTWRYGVPLRSTVPLGTGG